MKQIQDKSFRLWAQFFQRNEFLRKFTTVLGVDILVKASSFILLPVFLRLMSQDEFGLYNYLLSIIQTFSLVLNLGLYIPQTKLYHNYDSTEKRGELLFTISMTLLVFLVSFSILFGIFGLDYKLVSFLSDDLANYSRYRGFVFLSLLVTVGSFMLTNFFYTSEKIRLVRRYNVYRIVVVNVASVLALYLIPGDKVTIRITANYLSELVLFLLFLIYLVRELVPNFKRQLMWKSLLMGLPIMVSAIFGIVVNFGDKFFLQKYGTLKDLSNYYLAFSFASIIPLIFASLQNVWLPIFMKEKNVEENFRKTRKLIYRIFFSFIGLSLLIWLLFEILLITTVIPSKYSMVTWILPLLLVTQIFAAITSLFSNYLVYFEKTSLVIVTGLFVSIMSLCLGLWLIPKLGILGAAITTLSVNLAYMIIYYCLLLYFKKQYLPKGLHIIETVS